DVTRVRRLWYVHSEAHQLRVEVTHDARLQQIERKAQLGRRGSLLGRLGRWRAGLDRAVLLARDEVPPCCGAGGHDATATARARQLSLLLALDGDEATVVLTPDPATRRGHDGARSRAGRLVG